MTGEEIKQLRQRIAVGETMLNPDAILDALESSQRRVVMLEEYLWQTFKAFDEQDAETARAFVRTVCIMQGIMNEDGGRI